MNAEPLAAHTMRIRPNKNWLKIDWKELYEYRDLMWFLVRRDFTTIYKQSILGPVWFVIQPLVTTLVFTVVFGQIAKIGTEGVPSFLFYFSGIVLWNYFQGVMNGVSGTLIGNAGLFGKVYFPRLIVPLSLVITQLVTLALNVLMFAAFFLYYLFFTHASIQPSGWMVLLPFLVMYCAAVGLGVGLWLSALTAKYRDLRFALSFLSQLWMYATPIVYPLSLVPEKWVWLISLNPMTVPIELNRYIFLGTGTVNLPMIVSGGVLSLALLVSGLLVFNRVQRTFVDVV